jgi:hypothetical protein
MDEKIPRNLREEQFPNKGLGEALCPWAYCFSWPNSYHFLFLTKIVDLFFSRPWKFSFAARNFKNIPRYLSSELRGRKI